jgi:hypothetical protein
VKEIIHIITLKVKELNKRDQVSKEFIENLKKAGSFEEYEKNQKTKDPNLYSSQPNELPNLNKIKSETHAK